MLSNAGIHFNTQDSWDGLQGLQQVTIPDLWQQEAVAALRTGKDVVVHAPTGAGKTLIFELWSNQGKNRGQAIYTVPTRALANDKLAEWRARGWNVGIATGDISDNLSAPVIVATLETQKARLIAGDGPSLLVVDEYQMLGDPDRGLNYELAIALAPSQTQLLLLSGSVANPHHIVQWLNRLGRTAQLIRYDHRPVPLEEIQANNLSYHLPNDIQGYWPRLVAKALAEDLGPILIFAPRRQAAEIMANELAKYLPNPNPLNLTPEQRMITGEHLAKLLKSRITYHHSGLSYACRAGIIEPLTKAGQLRVVVATMGLAAGINFSLRSVALSGESYRREQVEQPLRSDEILQMFGRAGRRGLDETGFALVTSNGLRLIDASLASLSRGALVDWGTLLRIMSEASRAGLNPYAEAVRVQGRLFTNKRIFLGVEESLKNPVTPCGLRTDSERARLVRKRVREMFNSRQLWQPKPEPTLVAAGKVFFSPNATLSKGESGEPIALRSVLTEPVALEKIGFGNLCVVSEEDGVKVYGREMTVAERLNNGQILLTKWVRRLTLWPRRQVSVDEWNGKVILLLGEKLAMEKTPLVRLKEHPLKIVAEVSLAEQSLRVPIDDAGVALWRPSEREAIPVPCSQCSLVTDCQALPTSTGTALQWRRLNLVDETGTPTLKGQIVSFFSQGDGLAIAAALEDADYPIPDLVYDLANLDGGFRFCGDENRYMGRLAKVCNKAYGLVSIPGYLENGIPPKYGYGAAEIVAAVHQLPQSKYKWVTPILGVGDIDRMIIEWRSVLRQISHAPSLEGARWTALQSFAKDMLNEVASPTQREFPPLEHYQTRRIDHKLKLPRH